MSWTIDTGRWSAADPDVDAFVDENLISFAVWDLVIFLNTNPDTPESVSRLAEVLARQESDMEPAVRRLADSGILVACDVSGTECWTLSGDGQVRDLVARFIEMASRREYRLDFVRRVLGRITSG